MKINDLIISIIYLICLLLMSNSSFAQKEELWTIHQLEKLDLNEANVYVDRPTISAASYHIGKKSVLPASIFDRMMFVVNGSSRVIIKSTTLNLKEGDVVFLKANDAIEFSENLSVMLWTSKSNKVDHKEKTEKFTKEQIESLRNSSENIYHSFIETSTMVAGLYMLPKSLDGDDTLVHDFDEINYVVNGRAKFKMNETVMEVKPGSIMWVKRGVGHYFYDLSDDFDVFILFETINMDHDH